MSESVRSSLVQVRKITAPKGLIWMNVEGALHAKHLKANNPSKINAQDSVCGGVNKSIHWIWTV